MRIRVVLTGRSYHLATDTPEWLELQEGASVNDALSALSDMLSDGASLPPSCLIAVSGDHLGTLANHESRGLQEGDELAVIAPVAGG